MINHAKLVSKVAILCMYGLGDYDDVYSECFNVIYLNTLLFAFLKVGIDTTWHMMEATVVMTQCPFPNSILMNKLTLFRT